MLFWCETVAVAPNGFDDTGAQLAAELIDHAGDPRPAGVKGVRCDGLIDLTGGEHLPWPVGQQEQNVKLHRSQVYRLEAATVEKSATEARAVMAFAKIASSPSLKDRIINFPCGLPLSIMWRFLPVLPW